MQLFKRNGRQPRKLSDGNARSRLLAIAIGRVMKVWRNNARIIKIKWSVDSGQWRYLVYDTPRGPSKINNLCFCNASPPVGNFSDVWSSARFDPMQHICWWSRIAFPSALHCGEKLYNYARNRVKLSRRKTLFWWRSVEQQKCTGRVVDWSEMKDVLYNIFSKIFW